MPLSDSASNPTCSSTSAQTSPSSYGGFGIAPLNDRGDLRLTLVTQDGDQLSVDMRPIEVRGPFEHLQRRLAVPVTEAVER